MVIPFYRRHTQFVAAAISLILVAIIAIIDYQTGLDYELSIFYILPIFLAAWYGRTRWGLVIAVISVAAWFIADFDVLRAPSAYPILYWNSAVKLTTFIIIVFLIYQIKNQHYQLTRMAGQDPLTGLANRRAFYDAANMEIHKARRFTSAFTVAYIDVDDFKKINDRYGHNTGDIVLRQIAAIMRQNTRIVDLVARIGGDEFVILFPETGPEEAQTAVQKVRTLLAEAMQEESYPVTFSIGVVTFLEAPISLDVMIEMVDRAMYTVKQSAKNNVLFQTNRNEMSKG